MDSFSYGTDNPESTDMPKLTVTPVSVQFTHFPTWFRNPFGGYHQHFMYTSSYRELTYHSGSLCSLQTTFKIYPGVS